MTESHPHMVLTHIAIDRKTPQQKSEILASFAKSIETEQINGSIYKYRRWHLHFSHPQLKESSLEEKIKMIKEASEKLAA